MITDRMAMGINWFRLTGHAPVCLLDSTDIPSEKLSASTGITSSPQATISAVKSPGVNRVCNQLRIRREIPVQMGKGTPCALEFNSEVLHFQNPNALPSFVIDRADCL